MVWKIVWKFVCPLVFLAMLTFVWLGYQPPNYMGVVYPTWASVVGWSISASPLVFIVGTALYEFCASRGRLADRWQRLLCPEGDWGPALAVHRAEYYPLQVPEARRLVPAHYATKKKARSMPLYRQSNSELTLQTPLLSNGDANDVYNAPAESALTQRRQTQEKETII